MRDFDPTSLEMIDETELLEILGSAIDSLEDYAEFIKKVSQTRSVRLNSTALRISDESQLPTGINIEDGMVRADLEGSYRSGRLSLARVALHSLDARPVVATRVGESFEYYLQSAYDESGFISPQKVSSYLQGLDSTDGEVEWSTAEVIKETKGDVLDSDTTYEFTDTLDDAELTVQLHEIVSATNRIISMTFKLLRTEFGSSRTGTSFHMTTSEQQSPLAIDHIEPNGDVNLVLVTRESAKTESAGINELKDEATIPLKATQITRTQLADMLDILAYLDSKASS